MRSRGRSPRMGGQVVRRQQMLGAYRVQLGPRGRHVFTKRTLGDDTSLTVEPPPAATFDQAAFDALNKRTQEILSRLDEDAKARKYALIIGGASALFAAVKLGLVAFPALRSRRTA